MTEPGGNDVSAMIHATDVPEFIRQATVAPPPLDRTLFFTLDDPSLMSLEALLLSTLNSSGRTFEGRTGTVYGFSAGSGYPEIWVRDSATVLPFSRFFSGQEYSRTWIEEVFAEQAADGSIPDFVSAGRTGKNTVETDQETSLVHAAFLTYAYTGDDRWLVREIRGVRLIDRLERSMTWVLENRYNQTYGLVTGAFTADWGDVQFEDTPGTNVTPYTHYTCDVYDNAMFSRSCRDLARLQSAMGNNTRAAYWDRTAEGVAGSMNRFLWDGDLGYYRMHLLLSGDDLPFDDSGIFGMGGNTMAILAGCTNATQTRQILAQAQKNHGEQRATSIGCVLYPPYPDGFFSNPIMDEEYEYQNGGIWDWFGGRLILAEFEHGFSSDAARHLQEVAAKNSRIGGLYEWNTLEGAGRGSRNYTGSAGALGQCIIEGYFGISLTHDTLAIAPRLGDLNASIQISEPSTTRMVSYRYTSLPAGLVFEPDTNVPGPIQISLLVPEDSVPTSLRIDGSLQAYSTTAIGNDRYVTFFLANGSHRCEVELARS